MDGHVALINSKLNCLHTIWAYETNGITPISILTFNLTNSK
jgi:hypothetical protein